MAVASVESGLNGLEIKNDTAKIESNNAVKENGQHAESEDDEDEAEDAETAGADDGAAKKKKKRKPRKKKKKTVHKWTCWILLIFNQIQ